MNNTPTPKTKERKPDIRQMAMIGLMTAVICVIAPFSLNIPVSPVPLSLGTMVVYFAVIVLGMKRGTISVALYILLGLAGLPVFTNFTPGAAKLFGPTGGYIIGYLFLAMIFGFFADHGKNRLYPQLIGALLGTIALYFFGTVWLKYQTGMSFTAALWAGSLPYIPGDMIKLALSLGIGMPLRKALLKAGLLPAPTPFPNPPQNTGLCK